jgi:hypothetical protein
MITYYLKTMDAADVTSELIYCKHCINNNDFHINCVALSLMFNNLVALKYEIISSRTSYSKEFNHAIEFICVYLCN